MRTSTRMVVLGRFKGVLDLILAIASVAYGLRRLYGSWTGAAIRVERSSDNAQLDIGFTASGDLDIAALLAFVGSGSGFVTIWYDQSGNNRHATQTTAGSQPRIVNNGVLETLNGKPSVRWDGSNDSLLLPSGFLFNQSQFSINMVTQAPPTNRLAAVFAPQNTNSRGLELTYHGGYFYPTLIRINGTIRNIPQTSFFSTDNIPTISTLSSTPTVQNGWLNGSVFPSLSGGGNSPLNFNGTYAFGVFDANKFALMTMSEFIITDTVLSTTDRQTLERNQGNFYSIAVA